MASSQVEIVSSSPFDCILHKSRGKDTNQNSKTRFQGNLKEFVRDHFKSCISITTRDSNIEQNPDLRRKNSDQDEKNIYAMSNRQPQVLNRWANQQGKEMSNRMETTNQETEVIRLSKSNSVSSKASDSFRDPSPTPSENSSTDFSVSSLVQRWRGFESESKYTNQTNNNIQVHNVALDQHVDLNNKESLDPYLCTLTQTPKEDESLFIDKTTTHQELELYQQHEDEHEQHTTTTSMSHSEGEKERLRVADIVSKWAKTTHQDANKDLSKGCIPSLWPSLARLRIGMDIGDAPICSTVVSSPKLRGRQALIDLLTRMERDRYKEVQALASRQVVSKFPQRGRIQSLLRLQLLRRQVSAHGCKEACESIQSKVISARITVRDRCNTQTNEEFIVTRNSLKDVINTNKGGDHSESSPTNTTLRQEIYHGDCKLSDEITSTPKQTVKESNSQVCMDQESLNKNEASSTNCDQDKAKSCINYEQQKKHQLVDGNCRRQQLFHNQIEPTNCGPLPTPCSKDDQKETQSPEVVQQSSVLLEQNMSNEVESVPSIDTTSDIEDDKVDEEEERDENENENENEDEDEDEEDIILEEQDDDHEFYFGTNVDWFTEIARPRSYWEDLRQAWYQEVFTTRSQDEEIRKLLERGSVSTVLASDFREKMDRMVMSSIQRVYHSTTDDNLRVVIGDEVEQESSNEVTETPQRREHDYLGGHEELEFVHKEVYSNNEHEIHNKEIRDEENEVEDEEEQGRKQNLSSNIQNYDHNVDDYYDETPSPPHLPWSEYPDHEMTDECDQFASKSLRKSSLENFECHITNEGSSPKNISQIEIELIYDLRSNMQQLHREMFELRKSITNCMKMQVRLERFIIERAPLTTNLTDKDKAENLKKGYCSICHENKVNSLLYRCGHMCTCFDCASELQWRSGKCPICKANIIDVVLIHPNARLD